jgi:cell division protein FtsB
MAKNAGPEKQKLVARKEDLEAKIDRLKYQKAALAPEVYRQQLSALLLELARTQAEIDR